MSSSTSSPSCRTSTAAEPAQPSTGNAITIVSGRSGSVGQPLKKRFWKSRSKGPRGVMGPPWPGPPTRRDLCRMPASVIGSSLRRGGDMAGTIDAPEADGATAGRPGAPDAARLYHRTLAVVAASQVFGGAGFAAGVTVASLLAADLLGSDRLAGLPTVLFTAGSAAAPVARRGVSPGHRPPPRAPARLPRRGPGGGGGGGPARGPVPPP